MHYDPEDDGKIASSALFAACRLHAAETLGPTRLLLKRRGADCAVASEGPNRSKRVSTLRIIVRGAEHGTAPCTSGA